MSGAAEIYYRQQAQEIDAPVIPPLLNGDPVDILPRNGLGVAASLMQFTDEIVPLEDFALHGVRAVPLSDGRIMDDEEWQRVQTLPRQQRFITADTYARRHVAPFIEQTVADGAAELHLEAVARHEVPTTALRRAMGKRVYYGDAAYEPSQVYVMMRAVDAVGEITTRLTVMQGVYEDVTYAGRTEYLTSRMGGTLLRPDEMAAYEDVLKLSKATQ